MTAAASATNLPGNLEALVPRLTTQRYRAPRGRRCSLPKANGKDRPVGLPARAATRVPLAGATRLPAISAPDVLECRDGSRPGRGAHEAVRDRTCARQDGPSGSLVAADVPGVGDQRDHAGLLTLVRARMDDRALLRLLRTGLQAGLLESDGHVVPPEPGSPPGGSSSPVLAQGYVP